MRWPIAILLLLPILACAVPSKRVLVGKVVKVTGGDTITILTTDNQQERISLWGIVGRADGCGTLGVEEGCEGAVNAD